MKAYACIKIRHHPDTTGQGAQYGDICLFLPMDYQFSKRMLDFFLPVPVDISIPCGHKFMKSMWGKCGECKNNDPDLCDVQKYSRAEWGEGEILEAPRIIHKHRFRVDIDTVIPSDTLSLMVKDEKTDLERATILDWADKAIGVTDSITDKVEVIKIN